MAMPDAVLEQQLALKDVAGFLRRFIHTLRTRGLDEATLTTLLQDSVRVECVQCNRRLSAEEILGIATSDAGAGGESSVKRVAQGYCSREGCESYFCGFRLYPHADVDWMQVMAAMALAGHQEEPTKNPGLSDEARAERWVRNKVLLARIGVGLGIIVVLLMIRQWYVGGTIPILREGERFTVDPAFSEDGYDPATRDGTPSGGQ